MKFCVVCSWHSVGSVACSLIGWCGWRYVTFIGWSFGFISCCAVLHIAIFWSSFSLFFSGFLRYKLILLIDFPKRSTVFWSEFVLDTWSYQAFSVWDCRSRQARLCTEVSLALFDWCSLAHDVQPSGSPGTAENFSSPLWQFVFHIFLWNFSVFAHFSW